MAKNAKNKKRTPPEEIDKAGNSTKRKKSTFDWDGDGASDDWPPDAMIADVIGNGRENSDGCSDSGNDDIF